MGSHHTHIPNHTTDLETGFIESNAYIYAFDAERKEIFLKRLLANGLSLYDTCDELGLSHKTVFKHYREDDSFRKAFDQAEREYYDRLEGMSRRNALNSDRSVVERIFQLNSGSRKGLTRGKYTDEKSYGPMQVSVTIDGKSFGMIKDREEIVEADLVHSDDTSDDKVTPELRYDLPPQAA